MKLKVHNVVTFLDKMTSPTDQIFDWVLPVLESQYPGGLVVVNGSTTAERDSLPDALSEYQRMRGRYGKEEETSQFHVELVYGRGNVAVKAIAKAIKKSVVRTKPQPKKKAVDKPKVSA